MKEIKAFQANDGTVFPREEDAATHELLLFLKDWIKKWKIHFESENEEECFLNAMLREPTIMSERLREHGILCGEKGPKDAR